MAKAHTGITLLLAGLLLSGCSDADSLGPVPTFESATALAKRIRTGEITSRQLLEHYLERIDRFDGELGAVVAMDVEAARRRADGADEALRDGRSWGRLHGLPITIKDSFRVVGMPTTAGEFPDLMPEENAVAVQRLIDEGAIVFGKTNVPSLLSDWQTFNDIYGTTSNPWDTARTPGGSSGGAAVAVATGFAAFELGSDIAGSIRIPSGFVGVYGHKPTHGIVPLAGHIPPVPPSVRVPGVPPADIAVAGPIARSVDDLELLLDVLTAEGGETGPVELPPARRGRLEAYRVAVWFDDPALEMDDGVRAVLDDAVAALRDAGLEVDTRARPAFELASYFRTYFRILAGRLTGNAVPPEAIAEARRLIVAWDAFFSEYDVLLCPVAPVTAFPHDHDLRTRRIVVNGRDRPYVDLPIWSSLATLAGLPSTAVPVGTSDEGLPVGIQILGPPLADRTTLDFARRLAEHVGGYEPPPGY